MAPDKKMTTIWVSKGHKALLDKANANMGGRKSYDEIIGMFLRQECDVWFDLLSVDGDSPVGHEIIFKLGQVTYICKDGESKETKIKIVAEGTEVGKAT